MRTPTEIQIAIERCHVKMQEALESGDRESADAYADYIVALEWALGKNDPDCLLSDPVVKLVGVN